MKLGDYSRNRFLHTFADWRVPQDYAEPMLNYFVYGFSPGSFFTAVLANDFMRAMDCSHSANSIPALKALVGWIRDTTPPVAWGSYEAVQKWIELEHDVRWATLESRRLVYAKEDEMIKVLQGERTHEPILW
jgi:hypothetical protein